MDMGADLLPCLGCSKHSDYRDLGLLLELRGFDIASKQRIKSRGRRLVVIDTIHTDTKKVHIVRDVQAGGHKGSSNEGVIVHECKKQ